MPPFNGRNAVENVVGKRVSPPHDRGMADPRSPVRNLVLTLDNAAEVLDHEPVMPPSLGYTRTMHHSSLLEPGDLWRPTAHEHPHVVRSVDHDEGRRPGPDLS